MRKAPLFLLLIATLATIPAADAKVRDKSWEFGALLGNMDADRSAEISNGISGELRFGYNFTSKVAVELWLSDEQTEHGNTPDFDLLTAEEIREPACPDNFQNNDPDCLERIDAVRPDINKDVEFRRGIVAVTGHFLTDRETRTIPYLSAGLGVIQEIRSDYTFESDYVISVDDPNQTGGARIERRFRRALPNDGPPLTGDILESFDSSAILVLSVGAKTFLSDNWGIQYEVGYAHHNSFEVNQDEYAIRVGATWVVGGEE